jgi:diadenosine tetraphosphatase ApaH/serine/threonine PP2A family protein phosphatase
LMGNHDWYLATGEGCPRSNSANRCLEYQKGIISDRNLAWLASLKSQASIHGLEIVHGGWNDPVDEYVTPSAEYFARLSGAYFASGHTHVQCLWNGLGKMYCNPGSVGQPRDGDPRAAFALWDGAQFTLHRIEYDIGEMQREMARAGFEPYFYENLASGARIGGKIDRVTV